MSLIETIQRQICYAHQIDPQLLGLPTPANLGGNNDFEYSYKVFDISVIQPAQRELEMIFNKFISINKIPTKLKFNDATLYTDPSKPVAGSPTANTATPVANDIEAQAKAALKGSVGGVQGILEIQKSVSAGLTDYTAALAILDLIYGFSEADARKILGTPVLKPITTT